MRTATSIDVRTLAGADLKVELPEGAAQPRIEISGDRTILNAQIKRLFPLSSPHRYYSVQDQDGNEVGIMETLEGLDHASLKVVEQDLDRRYFTPKILQLKKLKQEGGMWTFEVLTSRGDSTFFVRNWRDSSHEISPGRFVIQSVDGQRFEIENYEKLDTKSQLLIESLF